jgi:hypothetical protein
MVNYPIIGILISFILIFLLFEINDIDITNVNSLKKSYKEYPLVFYAAIAMALFAISPMASCNIYKNNTRKIVIEQTYPLENYDDDFHDSQLFEIESRILNPIHQENAEDSSTEKYVYPTLSEEINDKYYYDDNDRVQVHEKVSLDEPNKNQYEYPYKRTNGTYGIAEGFGETTPSNNISDIFDQIITSSKNNYVSLHTMINGKRYYLIMKQFKEKNIKWNDGKKYYSPKSCTVSDENLRPSIVLIREDVLSTDYGNFIDKNQSILTNIDQYKKKTKEISGRIKKHLELYYRDCGSSENNKITNNELDEFGNDTEVMNRKKLDFLPRYIHHFALTIAPQIQGVSSNRNEYILSGIFLDNVSNVNDILEENSKKDIHEYVMSGSNILSIGSDQNDKNRNFMCSIPIFLSSKVQETRFTIVSTNKKTIDESNNKNKNILEKTIRNSSSANPFDILPEKIKDKINIVFKSSINGKEYDLAYFPNIYIEEKEKYPKICTVGLAPRSGSPTGNAYKNATRIDFNVHFSRIPTISIQ